MSRPRGSSRGSNESSSSAEDARLLAVHPLDSSDPTYRNQDLEEDQDNTIMPSPIKLGTLRAYWLGTVVCTGGFLFGYDSGIVGGVLTLSSFERDFAYSKAQATRTQSLTVSLQQLGAFIGCFFVWRITHRLGRRKALMLCSAIFCAGVVVQTVNTGSLSAFYAARVFAGMGLGGATVVIPMYSSEMSPKELRGQIGCFFQLFYTLGIFMSYVLVYGIKRGFETSTSMQWQVPIGLQLVPGGLLGLGMLTLKESVRWLVQHDQLDAAWRSLAWIRASISPTVQAEFKEIKAGVANETRERSNFKLIELIRPPNFKLVTTGFLIFLAQQATGATAFAYFAPQYFGLLVGQDGTRNLLVTGIFGAVKVGACAAFVFFFADRVARRTALIAGAAFMAVCLFATAAVTKLQPATNTAANALPASGIATVTLIYLFVIAYNMSWGALPWPYVSEIFPTRIREPGIGVGVASQWLWAFVFTLVTPYMVSGLGWGAFAVWAVLNVVICAGTVVGVRETGGKSLEDINEELSDGGRRRKRTKDRDHGG